MSVEFSPVPTETLDFGEPLEIPMIASRPEDVQVRLEGNASARSEARRLDERWVYCMGTVAELDGSNAGILCLSDGVTSHTVACFGVTQDADDYLVIYQDPWGPKWGSFLERGKNVAGCSATYLGGESGAWCVRVGQLPGVLDSVILLSRNEEERDADSPAPT